MPPPWTPVSALTWLTVKAGPAELPVVPLLAGGRFPSLTLVRPQGDAVSADSRNVLRLWAVDIELTDSRRSPLWIGSIVEERLYRPLSLVTLTWTQPGMNRPREVLAAALEDGRLVPRANGTAVAYWDGQVLLARESGTLRAGLQNASDTASRSAPTGHASVSHAFGTGRRACQRRRQCNWWRRSSTASSGGHPRWDGHPCQRSGSSSRCAALSSWQAANRLGADTPTHRAFRQHGRRRQHRAKSGRHGHGRYGDRWRSGGGDGAGRGCGSGRGWRGTAGRGAPT